MSRRLDRKLDSIREGRYRPADFIIADAKDGDMAFGCTTPGPLRDAAGQPTGRYRPMRDYRADMRRIVASDLVDIMLTSLSSAEILAAEDCYSGSDITPAVRLNDASDIWAGRGASYQQFPALPFRSARLDRVRPVADLGLYAITFYNDLERDRLTLDRYARFRDEATDTGLRHFLEVFNPQVPVDTGDAEFAAYNNDAIVRCLAGVSALDRPLFLKAAYNGPRSTEEIASFDPENLVFGILGGGAGTTRDCLELIRQAEKYGARVALFGRKIYQAEDSVTMVRAMRRVIEQRIASDEGTRIYHDELQRAGITPRRSLRDDLELTDGLLKRHLD